MIFAESSARLILVLHTAFAVGCVGASTHLVLWLRPFRRRQFPKIKAVRRFAWLSLALYAATFIGGNIIYPTYKVRVRAQFFDDPAAVAREAALRAEAQQRVEELFGPGNLEPIVVERGDELARRTSKISRWFDTKEHWVALGFALALAVAIMLAGWKPRRETAVLGPIVFWLAFCSCAAAWLGAIIGVVVGSYRAVGGL